MLVSHLATLGSVLFTATIVMLVASLVGIFIERDRRGV